MPHTTTRARWPRPAATSSPKQPARPSTHVGSFSFDPEVLPGNIEGFSGVAQVPLGLRRPSARRRRARARRVLRAAGDHGGHAGRQLQPRHAPDARGRRHQDDRGRRRDAARAAVRLRDARAARDFGRWVEEQLRRRSRPRPRRPTSFGRLRSIEQYAVGKMRFLRFDFTTGDAGGQNMVTKATRHACHWMISRASTASSTSRWPPTSTPTRSTRC